MNKFSIVVLLLLLVLFSVPLFAQSTPSNNSAEIQRMIRAPYAATGGRGGMYPDIMNKEKIEKFTQSLIEVGLLSKMLAQPTMVAVDNGIIVAYGNTLRKYDKDLNVVKEVDLDMNVENMQKLASKFAKKYSADFMDLMGGLPGSPSAYTGPNAPNSNKPYDVQREEEIKKEIEQMK